MRNYAPPVLGSPRLGQLSNLLSAGGLTQDVAQQIVSAADAPTRAIIRDERNNLAEGLVGGLPFAALSGVAAVATYYLVDADAKTSKFIGYGISFASLGLGGWWTYNRITQVLTSPPPAGGPPPAVVQQTAQAIVTAAVPKIQQIVQDERTRIASAAMSGLPFAAGGALAAAASILLVHDDLWKVGGLAGAIALVTLGAWVALRAEIT